MSEVRVRVRIEARVGMRLSVRVSAQVSCVQGASAGCRVQGCRVARLQGCGCTHTHIEHTQHKVQERKHARVHARVVDEDTCKQYLECMQVGLGESQKKGRAGRRVHLPVSLCSPPPTTHAHPTMRCGFFQVKRRERFAAITRTHAQPVWSGLINTRRAYTSTIELG